MFEGEDEDMDDPPDVRTKLKKGKRKSSEQFDFSGSLGELGTFSTFISLFIVL